MQRWIELAFLVTMCFSDQQKDAHTILFYIYTQFLRADDVKGAWKRKKKYIILVR